MGRDTSPCGRFVEGHGTRAVALGRTAGELLGVHPVVGTIRVDCCGALMLSSAGRVTQVEAGLIRYANELAFRRAPEPRPSVPVWSFGPR
jgi:hypothetical protein